MAQWTFESEKYISAHDRRTFDRADDASGGQLKVEKTHFANRGVTCRSDRDYLANKVVSIPQFGRPQYGKLRIRLFEPHHHALSCEMFFQTRGLRIRF